MESDLNIVKQYEAFIKAFLLKEYGGFLPQDSISLLNTTNYVKDNYDNMTDDQIRGSLMRDILSDTINVECTKDIVLDDGKVLPLQYGEKLEESLIEYYAQNLSKKYNFPIDEIPELKEDLETIRLLNEKLEGGLDESVFSEDAVELLKKADFKELIEECDKDAIKRYLERNKEISAGLNDKDDKSKENEIMKENTARKNSVQMVWLDGKKYIKYVDKDGNVSLTEVLDDGITEEFYRTKLANLKPDEKLDPEEFKKELDEVMKEIHLTKTDDVKKENLGHKEMNMLNFINANKEIRYEAQRDVITHSDDMKIHVVESTNDIVTTEDKDYHVEAHIIKDGEAQAKSEDLQDTRDISSRVLSKDEYKELIEKFTRGEDLTLEELESLKRTSEAFIAEGESLSDVMESSKGPKLTQNNGFYGFSASSLVTLIICVGAICTLIMSLYLFIISIK